MKRNIRNVTVVILSAVIYALNVPLLKLYGDGLPSVFKSVLMYLGAVIGCLLTILGEKIFFKKKYNNKFTKKDILYLGIVCITDVVAAISLMYGLNKVSGDTASLLMSFQTVFSMLIAVIFFKEKVGIWGWLGLISIFGACVLVSFNGNDNGFSFDVNNLFIILPVLLWSIGNNFCKKIEVESEVVTCIKSLSAFIILTIISLILGDFKEFNSSLLVNYSIIALAGFLCYGVAIILLILSCKWMGTGIASCYNGISPIIGALLSILILKEEPYLFLYIAIGLVILGIVFCTINEHKKLKKIELIKENTLE